MTKEKVEQLCLQSKTSADFNMKLLKIDSAYAIAKAINYKEGMLKSKLLKAAWYLNSNDEVKPALEIIKEIEPDVLSSNDFESISFLKSLKGNSYVKLYFNDQAQKELNSALEYAEKIKNRNIRNERKGIIFMTIGAVYSNIQPLKKTEATNLSAYKNFKNAYKVLSLIKDGTVDQKLILLNSINTLANYYLQIEKPDSAKFYLDKSLRLAKELNDFNQLTYTFRLVGNYNLQKFDYLGAVKNLKESNRLIKLINGPKLDLIENYDNLAYAYEQLNDTQNHLKYVKAYKVLSHSLNDIHQDGVTEAVETIKQDTDIKNEKDKGIFKNLILIISVLVIVISFVAFIVYKRYRDEKNSKEEFKRLLDAKILDLNSNSSKFSQEDEEKLENVVRLAMTNDPSYFIKFSELFPNFSEKLLEIEPSLKANDLKICSYMRLNFDTKEIARYGRYSVRSVESKKYRLRKKFNITSSDDINIWMSKI